MGWTVPRSWAAGETETSGIFNSAVRDNLNVLKTCVTNSGHQVLCFKNWGSGAAAVTGGNQNSGSSQTDLTYFTVTVPADYLSGPGEGFRVLVWFSYAANANSKSFGCKINSSYSTSLLTGAYNGTNSIAVFDVKKHSSTTVAVIHGWVGANFTAGAATLYPVNNSISGLTASWWTSPWTFTLWAQGTASGDVRAYDPSYEMLLSAATAAP